MSNGISIRLLFFFLITAERKPYQRDDRCSTKRLTVQTEMVRRSMLGAAYSGNSIFASKLICGDCGKAYGKKKWHSTSKYAKDIYRCNARYNKGQAQCQTPNFTEEDIKARFIKAYNLVMYATRSRLLKIH